MKNIIKSLCLNALMIGSMSLAMDQGANGREQIDAERQAQLNQKFLAAHVVESTAEMQRLLAQGADINALDKWGSKLHETAKIRYSIPNKVYNACKFLLENNADVNLEDPTVGETPLMAAAYAGDPKICELFIQHGAEINKKSKENTTAFKRAAHMGNREVCKLLLEHNADPNTQDKWGWNGLMYAAEIDDKTCAFLLQQDVKLNLRNNEGDTALMIAIKNGSETKNALVREACKKIKSHKSLITLLGIKRKRQASALCEVPYDIVKLIAKELLELEEQELLSQIPENNRTLRLHIHRELKKSKTNQNANEDNHE